MHLRNTILLAALLSITAISCQKTSTAPPVTPPVIPPVTPANTLLHRSGNAIVDGNNQPVVLRGIGFGNEVWSDKEIPNTHHNEDDYVRVKGMGMNVIRFYMNYKTFENDNAPYQYKQAGWDWIDQNIAWAKKYGIFLILDMHVPQGGLQSLGKSDDLWNVTENQSRLTALWKAIAEKYKNEIQIAGFDLVNEPVPTTSKQQWQQLAQGITAEIRKVDVQHIIFVEQVLFVKGVSGTDSDQNFPVMPDNNTVYEFHFYDPFEFAYQLFSWSGLGDGGKYPDENIVNCNNSTWYTATFNNPAIATGTNDWKFYEGEKYQITDSKIKLGIPALVGDGVNGTVYFDDLVIKEYDPNGVFVQDIMASSLDDIYGWNYWSNNTTGSVGLSSVTGYSNNKSIFITGNTGVCNTPNYSKMFIPKQNYYYQINGWMKGDNVAATASCRLRIDFLTNNDPVYGRNKQFLETEIKKITNWAAIKNVPVYMGEFGVGIHCFENDKGGLQWVTDMIDIAKTNNIPFTYHQYHEDSFGLYYGYGTLPDPTKVNQPLVDLFKLKLK